MSILDAEFCSPTSTNYCNSLKRKKKKAILVEILLAWKVFFMDIEKVFIYAAIPPTYEDFQFEAAREQLSRVSVVRSHLKNSDVHIS